MLLGQYVINVWMNANADHCPLNGLRLTNIDRYQEPAFSSNLLSKQPLAPVEEHTMSRNTDNLGQDGTQRATLLRESRFHQEQADQAQVRLEELQGPIDGLEIDYQNLQDTVVDLEIRNNQLMQEVGY